MSEFYQIQKFKSRHSCNLNWLIPLLKGRRPPTALHATTALPALTVLPGLQPFRPCRPQKPSCNCLVELHPILPLSSNFFFCLCPPPLLLPESIEGGLIFHPGRIAPSTFHLNLCLSDVCHKRLFATFKKWVINFNLRSLLPKTTKEQCFNGAVVLPTYLLRYMQFCLRIKWS